MTDHATTNIDVIEAFLPVRFEVEEGGSSLWRVSLAARI
jgi:RNA 3'-terminal phosphate cyclase